jgi:hypothetical protein
MKRNLVFLLVALFVATAFSSCRKDRTCTCTYSDGSQTSYNIHSTKKVAEADCDLYVSSGVTCTLD